MRFVDEWPGSEIADRQGHTPGAWDCPCGPWVSTDADSDDPDEQVRTIRHVEMPDQPSPDGGIDLTDEEFEAFIKAARS